MQNTLGNQSSFITRKNISPPPNKLFLRAFWSIWLALRNFTVNKKDITSKHLLRAHIYEEICRILILPSSTFNLIS